MSIPTEFLAEPVIVVGKHVRVPVKFGPQQIEASINLTIDADGDVRIQDDTMDDNIFVNRDYLPALIEGLLEMMK